MSLQIYNDFLLSLCSEATLNNWSFCDQKLKISLTTYDKENALIIHIKTDTVYSSPLYANKNLNICRCEIQDMHEILEVQNGYYIPPKNFCDLMRFSKKHYSVYYGRKNMFNIIYLL